MMRELNSSELEKVQGGSLAMSIAGAWSSTVAGGATGAVIGGPVGAIVGGAVGLAIGIGGSVGYYLASSERHASRIRQ